MKMHRQHITDTGTISKLIRCDFYLISVFYVSTSPLTLCSSVINFFMYYVLPSMYLMYLILSPE